MWMEYVNSFPVKSSLSTCPPRPPLFIDFAFRRHHVHRTGRHLRPQYLFCKEYFRADRTPRQEATTAKITSLVFELGTLVFVVGIPPTFSIFRQILDGIWILQSVPVIANGPYTRWLQRSALLIGRLAGMITGTWMAVSLRFKTSIFGLRPGGSTVPLSGDLGPGPQPHPGGRADPGFPVRGPPFPSCRFKVCPLGNYFDLQFGQVLHYPSAFLKANSLTNARQLPVCDDKFHRTGPQDRLSC
jgi:hypothetical protein